MFISASSPSNLQQARHKRSGESEKRASGDRFSAGGVNLLSGDEQKLHQMGRLFKAAASPQLQEAEQSQSGEEISNFPGRNGYDKNFLGRTLDFPKIDSSMKDQVATLIDNPGRSELTYTNFSVVMNKVRRQPFFTAVNIDGKQSIDVPRNGKWTIDSRIPRDQQLGNEAYRNNSIDKGHMVRRSDPVWGPNAEQASNDTFVYTNAGLQHADLNQKTWLDLENYVLGQAREKGQKLTVMTGPVFADDDPDFDNHGKMDRPTQIPQEFWKLVVWNDSKDGLKCAAFVQSQKDYLGNSLFKSDFDPSGMSVYQVPLEKLESVTHLDFGDLKDSTQGTRALREGSDAVLS